MRTEPNDAEVVLAEIGDWTPQQDDLIWYFHHVSKWRIGRVIAFHTDLRNIWKIRIQPFGGLTPLRKGKRSTRSEITTRRYALEYRHKVRPFLHVKEDPVSALEPKDFVLAPYHMQVVEHCAASRVYRGPKEKPNFGMWWGISIHLFLQYAQTRGRYAALAYIRKKFPRSLKCCQGIDVDALPKGEVEEHILLNTGDRSVLEADSYRDAEAEEHVYMRADLWAPEDAHVIDYKSGEYKKDPLETDQMLTLGAAMWLRCGKPDEVDVSIANVIKTGEIVWTTESLTAERAEEHLYRVRHLHLLVLETRSERVDEGIEPPFEPGEHCQRCHARQACPSAAK